MSRADLNKKFDPKSKRKFKERTRKVIKIAELSDSEDENKDQVKKVCYDL